MLVTCENVKNVLQENNIKLKGIFHVGAHKCEEIEDYESLGVPRENIVWVEGIREYVLKAKKKGIPNVYQAVISDEDEKIVNFNITNNVQSSSILEFGTHKEQHKLVKVTKKMSKVSTTVDTFFASNNLDPSQYNMWCFDIQGAELMALKGSLKSLVHADLLYLEVNEKELYIGCALIGELDEFLDAHGFKRVETSMTKFGWGDAVYIRK